MYLLDQTVEVGAGEIDGEVLRVVYPVYFGAYELILKVPVFEAHH